MKVSPRKLKRLINETIRQSYDLNRKITFEEAARLFQILQKEKTGQFEPQNESDEELVVMLDQQKQKNSNILYFVNHYDSFVAKSDFYSWTTDALFEEIGEDNTKKITDAITDFLTIISKKLIELIKHEFHELLGAAELLQICESIFEISLRNNVKRNEYHDIQNQITFDMELGMFDGKSETLMKIFTEFLLTIAYPTSQLWSARKLLFLLIKELNAKEIMIASLHESKLWINLDIHIEDDQSGGIQEFEDAIKKYRLIFSFQKKWNLSV